ncbi:MAG: hypothetical protein FJY17_06535 [Bacteroidetes bacterium]|nr:hypothetical protein [Bacteroidota bacterium]
MRIFLLLILGFYVAACSTNEEASTKTQTPLDQLSSSTLDSLIKLYPDSIELFIARANMRLENVLEENGFGPFLEDAAEAFKLDSNRVDVRLLYAKALLYSPHEIIADKLNSKRIFQSVLTKDSTNVEALIGMANHYGFDQNEDEAFKFINKALRINPKYRDAYVLKGSIYRFKKNYKMMLSSYETAISLDPKFLQGYFYIGAYYQSINNPMCIEYYTSAYNLNPKDPDVIYPLAYAYEVFSKDYEAMKYYRQMAQADRSYFLAYFHIGSLKQFTYNEPDSAFYYYDLALKYQPNHVESLHNKGLLYEQIKDPTNALFTYAKALKINPEFAPTKARVKELKGAALRTIK